jgi:hypothetical protein
MTSVMRRVAARTTPPRTTTRTTHGHRPRSPPSRTKGEWGCTFGCKPCGTLTPTLPFTQLTRNAHTKQLFRCGKERISSTAALDRECASCLCGLKPATRTAHPPCRGHESCPPSFFVLEHRFMDMHEVVNEVSRPVTAASSRKGLGLTREYCVLVVAALRRHDAM